MVAVSAHYGSGTSRLRPDSFYGAKVGAEIEAVTCARTPDSA